MRMMVLAFAAAVLTSTAALAWSPDGNPGEPSRMVPRAGQPLVRGPADAPVCVCTRTGLPGARAGLRFTRDERGTGRPARLLPRHRAVVAGAFLGTAGGVVVRRTTRTRVIRSEAVESEYAVVSNYRRGAPNWGPAWYPPEVDAVPAFAVGLF